MSRLRRWVFGRLPEEFQGELDLAGCGGGAGDGACGAGYAGGIGGGGRSEDDQVGGVEVGAVEQVENFGAELQGHAFADAGVFESGEIPGGQAGADVGVATQVAVEAAVGGRSEKGFGVEPLIGIAEDDGAVEIGIQEWAHRIARVAVVRRVVAELRRERETGLRGDDAGDATIR